MNDGAAAIAATAHIPESVILCMKMKAIATIPTEAPAQAPAMATNG